MKIQSLKVAFLNGTISDCLENHFKRLSCNSAILQVRQVKLQ